MCSMPFILTEGSMDAKKKIARDLSSLAEPDPPEPLSF
jgi:hypothetical protein